jgi:two-component system, cell cycle response regulator DivK
MQAADDAATISALSAEIRRKVVLVIEDTPLNMKLFRAIIESQGHSVLEATSGPQGLELARRHHPDLIVTDIQLPDMSGFEVARRIKDDPGTQHIRVLATSAFAQFNDPDKIRDSGVDAYMAKPIAIAAFVELINAMLAGAPSPTLDGRSAA